MQSTQPERKSDKEKLFARIRNEKVTLFIGSGFSLAAGAPSARQIISALKKVHPDIEKNELKDVAEEYALRENENRDALIDAIQSLFPIHSACDDNQKALTRIPHFRQIFTTNYDSYIEDAYAQNCHVVREEKDMAEYSDDIVQIYKLHGDFTCQDNLVITQSDYNKFFANTRNSAIWKQLEISLLHSTVVFIGYSLDDLNVVDIINHVVEICGGTPHDMFMITPSTASYKANYLKKRGVTWINSYAEDFLAELEQDIKNHIFQDFRRKKVSARTFIDFCHIHDINPTIESHDDKNIVVQTHSYSGANLDRKIQLTFPSNLFNGSIWDYVKPIERYGKFKGLRGISIPTSAITSLECRLNGLREFGKDEIVHMSLILIPQRRITKIKIPSRNFIASIECEIKQVKETTFDCVFDFDICEFILTVVKDKENQHVVAASVHVEMNDTYKSQENAMRWIEVIDAIASGELVLFPELEGIQAQIENAEPNPFELYKRYYEMVQTIELSSNVTFSTYYNFSQTRYINALKLYYWLTNQEIIHKTQEGWDELILDFHNEIDTDDIKHMPPEQKFTMIIEHIMDPIEFNEQTFTIPHDYLCFENCNINGVDMLPDGKTKLRVGNPSTEFKEVFSTMPRFQDGECPNMLYFRLDHLH